MTKFILLTSLFSSFLEAAKWLMLQGVQKSASQSDIQFFQKISMNNLSSLTPSYILGNASRTVYENINSNYYTHHSYFSYEKKLGDRTRYDCGFTYIYSSLRVEPEYITNIGFKVKGVVNEKYV